MTTGERMTEYDNCTHEQLLDRIEDLQDRIVDLEEIVERQKSTCFNDMWRDELTDELNAYLDWRHSPNKKLSLEAQKSVEVTMLSLLRNKLKEE